MLLKKIWGFLTQTQKSITQIHRVITYISLLLYVYGQNQWEKVEKAEVNKFQLF